MLVILKENVSNLGHVGDVVRVTDGYARNFLLPRKLVDIADENNVAQFEHKKRTLEKKRAAQKLSAEEMAKKVSAISLTFTRKVSDKGHLFGSVTINDVHEALIKQGTNVDKVAIQMNEPIKALGTFSVNVRLLPDVVAACNVIVHKEA